MRSSIPIPHLVFSKKKERSQVCEMFTDDGRIIDIEPDVLRGCADDPETGMAFLIDPDNQMTNETGDWVQILSERSTLPVMMVKPKVIDDLKNIINSIFHECHENAKIIQYSARAKDAIMDKIQWIVVFSCSTVLLIFGAQFFFSRGGG